MALWHTCRKIKLWFNLAFSGHLGWLLRKNGENSTIVLVREVAEEARGRDTSQCQATNTSDQELREVQYFWPGSRLSYKPICYSRDVNRILYKLAANGPRPNYFHFTLIPGELLTAAESFKTNKVVRYAGAISNWSVLHGPSSQRRLCVISHYTTRYCTDRGHKVHSTDSLLLPGIFLWRVGFSTVNARRLSSNIALLTLGGFCSNKGKHGKCVAVERVNAIKKVKKMSTWFTHSSA